MSVPNDICLYWYQYSPYARKIAWYLQLRGIAYAQCLQPGTMPRPDLEKLNVNYRRIPLLSIGKDVYCDTRLILRKLESLFPDGALGAHDADQKALQRLLEKWTGDGGVFLRSTQLIPLDLPNMKDPQFIKDRENFSGRPWKKESIERARPEALAHIRDAYEFLETTLLADGRDWIFKTNKPTLGDIEAIWPLHWLDSMPGAVDPNYISVNQFPKTFAYIKRFDAALKASRSSAPKPVKVKIDDVIKSMSAGRFIESAGEVDASDPTGLKPGDIVTVGPIDTGASSPDTGKLLSLTPNEIVIAKQTNAPDNFEIHLHTPRYGFRTFKAKSGKL